MRCDTITVDGLTMECNDDRKCNIKSNTVEITDLTIQSSYKTGTILKKEWQVIGILASAFKENAYIQKLTIEEGVSTIEESAFEGCTNLKEISLPDSLTTIGDSCFKRIGIVSLVKSTFDGHSTIPSRCFQDCVSLTKIALPSTVKMLEGYCFSGCTSLGSIDFYTGVELVIGTFSFQECTSLKKIIFPKGLTTIGYGAFQKCTSLTDIMLSSTIIEIKDYAFYYTNLDSVYSINLQGVKSVGNTVFAHSHMTKIKFGSNVSEIGTQIRMDCDTLHTADLSQSKVTQLRASSFSECIKLETVKLPSTLTEIGTWCFNKCSALQFISFPESLTKINTFSFSYSGLNNLTLPQGLTKLFNSAFMNCSNLKGDLTIPPLITNIPTNCFKDSPFTNGILDLGNVKSLNSGAFASCQFIEIKFSTSLDTVSKYSFQYSIVKIFNLSETRMITTLSESFSSTLMEILVLPKSLKVISSSTFRNNTYLKGSLIIPETLTHIGEDAFVSANFDYIEYLGTNNFSDEAFIFSDKDEIVYVPQDYHGNNFFGHPIAKKSDESITEQIDEESSMEASNEATELTQDNTDEKMNSEESNLKNDEIRKQIKKNETIVISCVVLFSCLSVAITCIGSFIIYHLLHDEHNAEHNDLSADSI